MRSILLFAVATLPLPLAAQFSPSTMQQTGTVDLRFQSYNVEMVEVVGGRFWKPYGSGAKAAETSTGTPGGLDPSLFEKRTPIDLANPRLRKLAAALGPAYMRVSGSWQNTVFFDDSATGTVTTPPTGFNSVLTRAQWQGVADFARAVDARIVTSFATSAGTRDATGTWNPIEAKKFMDFAQSTGSPIAAAEYMNEPTFANIAGAPAGYDGTAYGRDFAVFQQFFRTAAPHAILLGPGSVGEGIELAPMKLLPSKDLLTAMGPNAVDVFSYHFYGGVSERCSQGIASKSGTTPNAALSAEWLSRTATVEDFYAKLRDTYAPGKPMWLTETGQTACGGDRWAATDLDTFRYLDQLGQLAQRHVQVVMHNTLSASDYGLVDEKTLVPRPNYWAALLWHNLMGTTVLDAGASPSPTLHVYAQCMKSSPGGVTLLALNLDRAEAQTIQVPTASQRYTMTAQDPMSRSVQLNGRELSLTPTGDVPRLAGAPEKAGAVRLPAASITFLTVAAANNPACR